MLHSVLTDRARILGDDHPDTIDARFKLAEIATSKGQKRDAIDQCRSILAAQEHVLGGDHPLTQMTRHAIHALATGQDHQTTWPAWP